MNAGEIHGLAVHLYLADLKARGLMEAEGVGAGIELGLVAALGRGNPDGELTLAVLHHADGGTAVSSLHIGLGGAVVLIKLVAIVGLTVTGVNVQSQLVPIRGGQGIGIVGQHRKAAAPHENGGGVQGVAYGNGLRPREGIARPYVHPRAVGDEHLTLFIAVIREDRTVVELCLGLPAFLVVFDHQLAGLSLFNTEGGVLGQHRIRCRPVVDHELTVHLDTDAIVRKGRDTDGILGAVGQRSRPTDAVLIGSQPVAGGTDSPIEVYGGIHTGHVGFTLQIRVGVVGGGKPLRSVRRGEPLGGDGDVVGV